MIQDLTDKEQIELIKKWWNQYGKIALIAIIVGLAIGFGWRYWRQHKIVQAENASMVYEQLQDAAAQKQFAKTAPLAQKLIKDYRDTPYASMGALIAARDAVLQNNLQLALTKLQWIINNTKSNSLKQIARLRSARILLAQKKYQAAINTLKTVDDPVYRPLINSVKGDIYHAMGKTAQANQFYHAAQSGFEADGILDPFLNMKMTQHE